MENTSPPTLHRIAAFMAGIEELRANLSREVWMRFVKEDASLKAWRFFLSCDPYTRWALMKPRGYAGDAGLMDFAYGHATTSQLVAASGEIGAAVYDITFKATQSQSARERISLIASTIKASLRSGAKVELMSFASGHARELELLTEAEKERIGRFTAIDIDAQSLQIASEAAAGMNFLPISRNVLTSSFSDLPRAELVYSLGLFDYLGQRSACRVLRKMWQAVAPGGRMIVANLAHDAGNLAYCEAIMDWWMIPRSEQDMRELGQALDEDGDAAAASLARHGCFYYLEVVKRQSPS